MECTRRMRFFRIAHGAIVYVFVVTISLFGCGHDHSSDTPSTTTTTTTPIVPASSFTTVTGKVYMGPFTTGRVNIFAAPGGKKIQLLGVADIDANGAYTADLTNYTGAIMAEAYGSFVDEATTDTMQVQSSTPIRSFTTVNNGANTLMVTGLTELAVTSGCSNGCNEASIALANTNLSTYYGFNISTTPPNLAGTMNSQAYAVVLASISEYTMLYSNNNVYSALTSLSNELAAYGTFSDATMSTLSQAIMLYMAGPANTAKLTASTPGVKQALQAGYKPINLTLSYTGVGASKVFGTDMTIPLPQGVTAPRNPLASDISSAFIETVPGDHFNVIRLEGNTLRIVSTADVPGLDNGAFATITLLVSPWATPPTSLTPSTVFLSSASHTAIPGTVTVSLRPVGPTISM